MQELAFVGRRLLGAWCALTATAISALAVGLAVRGREFFYVFQGPADASLVEVKFVVFALAWCWLGLALWLTGRTELLRRHGAFLVAFVLIGLVYLNAIRGPHKVEHQDFSNYFTAASHMRAAIPLSRDPFQLYLYPPLLATLLEPFVPLGLGAASWAFRLVNYAGLLLFTGLIYTALQRIGASRVLSAGLVFVAMAANVAVADTLAAQQVNIHVANLILAALLLYPRHVLLSAAALALGAHLKLYPVLLALPFIYLRQWRWCFWFAATASLVIAATSLANSVGYYFEFVELSAGLREPGIRNASLASLLHNTARLTGVELGGAERAVSLVLQTGVAALVAFSGLRVMRQGLLVRIGSSKERVAVSSFVGLSIAMLVVSPSVWPHHFVLVLFPALSILLAVRTVSDATLVGVAYFLVFLVPVHEVFPFSYLRFGGLLMFGAVFARSGSAAAAGEPRLLDRLESRLARSFGADTP